MSRCRARRGRGSWASPYGDDCLVHYEAPEIARTVLDTGEAEPTREAEIYALGSALLISATGRRAVEYPDDAPRPVQREAVAKDRRRSLKAAGELG